MGKEGSPIPGLERQIKPRFTKPQAAAFRSQVKPLLEQGLSHGQIAEELKVERGQVGYASFVLHQAGEVKRSSRTSQELSDLTAQIKKLRIQDLDNNEIASRLSTSERSVSLDTVRQIASRLIAVGEIAPRTKRRSRIEAGEPTRGEAQEASSLPEQSSLIAQVERLRDLQLSDGAVALVNRALGNGDLLRQLLIGDNASILARFRSEIETIDSSEILSLLRVILRGCATEDDFWDVDRRDGALELLEGGVDIAAVEPVQVAATHLEGIRLLGSHPDPEGSVDSTIQAGQILLPYIPTDAQARNTMIQAWVEVGGKYKVKNRRIVEAKVRKALPEFSLVEQVKRLKAQGLTEAAIRVELGTTPWHYASALKTLAIGGEVTIRKSRSAGVIAAFDKDVQRLFQQKLSTADIAVALHSNGSQVTKSVSRLLASDAIERKRTSTKDLAELDKQVLVMVRKGLTNGEIAARLKKKKPQIQKSVRRLIRAGKMVAGGRREKPPRRESTWHFDERVKKLRDANFLRPQIARLLGARESRVEKAIARLRAAGQAESKKGKKRGQTHAIVIFDVQVARLRTQGVASIDEIVSAIPGASRWKVTRSLHRLFEQDQVKRARTSAQEMAQRIAEVRDLVRKGLTNEEIEYKLILSKVQVTKAKRYLRRTGETVPRRRSKRSGDYL